ncbi:MAG TPA: PQQ-dependent sugar dehydrogenase [Gemmatimonadales bacterium]|nr:PQQ-dependent sugar dehydrogenase [Gemmatimonadales bacterium]
MRPWLLGLAALCSLSAAAACDDSSPGGGGGGPDTTSNALTLQPIASGLTNPTFLSSPPGDTGRLFVLEQNGYVRIIKHGVLLDTPFLDIHTLVSGGSEQGLLGFAFYPDYATSGRFIVSYTSPDGPEAGGTSILARYTVSANADVANATADRILLTVDQPYDNHNGGGIIFGPDGYLYFGLGDGGSGGDPQGHGQDRTDLLGSLLRLDVSGTGGYTIPATNPYAVSATFKHELWNYGLRNPWRYSFDRQTGDLYIGDVGQGEVEEIDVAAASSTGGQNYGWNEVEGDQCYTDGCNMALYTPPVLTYHHTDGCAVIGGYVYRGGDISNLPGTYFYSDACSGFVRSFRWSAGQATERTEWSGLGVDDGVQSFGEDARGELYLLTAGGRVLKIVKRP